MKCIDELKKYNIKDISLKTRITQGRIKLIIDCDFENIDKVRAKGFVKILSREYNIDFSEWIEAFDAYYAKKEIELKQEQEENTQEKEDNKPKITFVDTTMRDNMYVRLFIILVILLVLFVIYFIYNNFIATDSKATSETTDKVVAEAHGNLENKDSSNTLELEIPQNHNATKISSNDIAPEVKVKDDKTNDQGQVEQTEIVEIPSIDSETRIPTLTITPKSPLWIGIIDLDTYQKKQLSASNPYEIKLDKNKLIRTGHGYFDIVAPQGFSKKYVGGNNKYFIYTQKNGLKELNKQEFLEFNRGEEW